MAKGSRSHVGFRRLRRRFRDSARFRLAHNGVLMSAVRDALFCRLAGSGRGEDGRDEVAGIPQEDREQYQSLDAVDDVSQCQVGLAFAHGDQG